MAEPTQGHVTGPDGALDSEVGVTRVSQRPVRQPMRVVAMAGRVESRPSGSRVWL